VRGFEDSSLGPRSTPNAADPDRDALPFGGNVLVQGGVEVLFPMPFVKDQRSLRTSLFWDVGNVYDTNCPSQSESCSDIDFGDMASSVGVGLTWLTAMGPLSFSLAMPVVKPDESDTQVFQFSLGQTF